MKLLEILKINIISFESLFLAFVITFLFYYPGIFEGIGNHFKNNNDIWKFLPTIPLLICSFSINYAWKILMPMDSGSNRILHEWPNYWKLKYRVISSIFICAACASGSIIIWIFSSNLSARIIGATFIASCFISLIVAFNQLLAAFKVREFMEP
jgi:hypothetical protein